MNNYKFNIIAKIGIAFMITLSFLPFVFAGGIVSVNAAALNEAPICSFTFTVDDKFVIFTDLSNDTSGNIMFWNWSFGDGNYSDVQNPVHNYADYAYYNVTLNVTDSGGLYNNITHQIQTYAGALGMIDYITQIFLFTLMILFASLGEYTHHQYIYQKNPTKRGTILFLFVGIIALSLCFTAEIQAMEWLMAVLIIIAIVYFARWGIFGKGRSP